VQTPPSSSDPYPPFSPPSAFFDSNNSSSQATPQFNSLGEWETDQVAMGSSSPEGEEGLAADDLEQLLQALREP
jgi:hypothetical protein